MTKPAFPAWAYVLAPALVFAAVFTIAWRYSHSAATQNVTMGDTQMLVTAGELLELIGREDVKLDARTESFRKEKLPRGGRQLAYHCASTKPALDLWSQVTAELDVADAQVTFAGLVDQLTAPGTTLEVHNPPIVWGEETRYGVLLHDGRLAGHVFLARKATRVVFYRFVGVTFADPVKLEAHLRPRLAAAEGFAP